MKQYFFARDICFSGNYNYQMLLSFGLKDESSVFLSFPGDQAYIDSADWDRGAVVDLFTSCIQTSCSPATPEPPCPGPSFGAGIGAGIGISAGVLIATAIIGHCCGCKISLGGEDGYISIN